MAYTLQSGNVLSDMDYATALDLLLEEADRNLPDEDDDTPYFETLLQGLETLEAFANDHCDELDELYAVPDTADPACEFLNEKPFDQWTPKYSWLDAVSVVKLLAETSLPDDEDGVPETEDQLRLRQALEIFSYLAARYGAAISAQWATERMKTEG